MDLLAICMLSLEKCLFRSLVCFVTGTVPVKSMVILSHACRDGYHRKTNKSHQVLVRVRGAWSLARRWECAAVQMLQQTMQRVLTKLHTEPP